MTSVLVVGGGSIGQRHALNALTHSPDTTVSLVSTHSVISSQLTSHDRVSISSKIILDRHYDYAIIASPSSKHILDFNACKSNCNSILIEKPLYSAWDSLPDEINFSVEDYKKTSVGYVLRFDPIICKTKQIVQSNSYGPVRKARVWAGQYLKDWRPSVNYMNTVSANKNLGGGVLHELSHELDYITFLLGFPEKVIAISGKYSDLKLDVEDSIDVLMSYPDKSVTVSLDFIAKSPSLGFELLLDQATITADFTKRLLVIAQNNESQASIPMKLDSFNDLYLEQQQYMLDWASNRDNNLNNTSPYEPCGLRHGQDVMSLVQSILLSCDNQEWSNFNFSNS